MKESLGVALVGCGTVGSGVARLLLEHPERMAARAGRALHLRRVVVRDLDKPRAVKIPRELMTTDLDAVIRDPQVQVVAELVGGIDWARQAVLRLLAAGKDVVTANKALLATHGIEIFDAARRHNRAIAFEGSVAGGVPIIAALTQSLAANQILSLQGILNGTSNFILTGMSEQGQTYAEALARPSGSVTPRPTPPSTSMAPTPPTSSPSSRKSPSAWPCLCRPSSATVSRRSSRSTSASPESWVTRSNYWPRPGSTRIWWRCTSRRFCSASTRRWRRCAAPTTPSPWSVTRSATRSITARGQARCRPPAPLPPTSSTWPSAGRSAPSRHCVSGQAMGRN